MRASHILIGVDAGAGTEEKERAKQKADAILEKGKSGADLAELAKSESTCPRAQQGGDLANSDGVRWSHPSRMPLSVWNPVT
jgi:peptidyl-prolyl cis-trans isomerase C